MDFFKKQKEKFLAVGSVFSAIIASLCWGGGLILASLGLGGITTAYFSNMSRFKPFFVLLTAFFIYKAHGIIEKKESKNLKILFFISSGLAILILYYPIILGLFF